MDPGTAISVVSLSFQVFSGCIKGYQLLSDARGMPKEFHYLCVRLKTEEYRLLDWAHVAQLDGHDENLLISNASKGLLIDVLDQQDRLLQRFGRYDEKYKVLRRPLICEDDEAQDDPPAYTDNYEPANKTVTRAETSFQSRFPHSEMLMTKALGSATSFRHYPKRLRWAAWDKSKLEALIGKLTSLNDFMRELLNSSQLQSLAVKQTRTDFQIMQLNGKIDYLVQIFEAEIMRSSTRGLAVGLPSDTMSALLQARGVAGAMAFGEVNSDEQSDEKGYLHAQEGTHNLASLAQAKALNLTVEDQSLLTDSLAKDLSLGRTAFEIKSVEISRGDITLLDKESEDVLPDSQRVEAVYASMSTDGQYTKKQVWIEWKSYDPMTFNGGPDPKVLERIKAIATLLKENNRTEQFRAPQCLGYFHDIEIEGGDDDRCRLGLVFEKPQGVHPSARPTSLLDLLRDTHSGIPSLTDRIVLMTRLAECIERLHAVNWLHKGLRSHNILFFNTAPSPPPDTTNGMNSDHSVIDFSQPYISGFDYSRPAHNEEFTEQPPENAAYDLYRHPRVQGSGNRDPSPLPAASSSVRGDNAGTSPSQPSGFKKSYDLYSLGIILLEIAYWQPIDVILGIPNLASTKPSTTIRVRQRLLAASPETSSGGGGGGSGNVSFLGFVRSRSGNSVEAVVRACLEGPTAFGIGEGEDERNEEVGARLQSGFFDQVVGRLQAIRV